MDDSTVVVKGIIVTGYVVGRATVDSGESRDVASALRV